MTSRLNSIFALIHSIIRESAQITHSFDYSRRKSFFTLQRIIFIPSHIIYGSLTVLSAYLYCNAFYVFYFVCVRNTYLLFYSFQLNLFSCVVRERWLIQRIYECNFLSFVTICSLFTSFYSSFIRQGKSEWYE